VISVSKIIQEMSMNNAIRMGFPASALAAIALLGCLSGCAKRSETPDTLIVETWDCGTVPKTVTATLRVDGTLTVSGAGDMEDYKRDDDDTNENDCGCDCEVSDSYGDDGHPWSNHVGDIIKVVIKDGVTHVGKGAFFGCVNLKTVSIGKRTASIGSKAFGHCTDLASVTIPNSVTLIEEQAFYGSTALKSVINLNPVPPAIKKDAFADVVLASACLYVPEGVVDAYKSSEQWKEFDCIKAADTRTVTAINTPPETRDALLDIPNTLIDKRDGKTYKTVEIGKRIWMVENLNYRPLSDSSWCYRDSDSYCDKYGRLYDWENAMTVCPQGWKLPSLRDWDILGRAAKSGRMKAEIAFGAAPVKR